MKTNILLIFSIIGLLPLVSCNNSRNKEYVYIRNENEAKVLMMSKSVSVVVGVLTNGDNMFVVMQNGKRIIDAHVSSNWFSIDTVHYETNKITTTYDGNGDGIPEWRAITDSSNKFQRMEMYLDGKFVLPERKGNNWCFNGRIMQQLDYKWVLIDETNNNSLIETYTNQPYGWSTQQ